MNTTLDLFQKDHRQFIEKELGMSQWIDLYSCHRNDDEDYTYWAALIPSRFDARALETNDWDFSIGNGHPGCIQYGLPRNKVKYHRYGRDDGIEPIVIERSFHGLRPDEFEISEEFRLFHNLFFDSKRNKYVKIDNDGEEEDVVLVQQHSIRASAVHLKQFLAIKNMRLALYFDLRRFVHKALADLDLDVRSEQVIKENLRFSISIGDGSISGPCTFSRLFGKKLISGFAKKDSDFWPYNEKGKKSYERFIIALDSKGKPITASCDPAHLPPTGYLTPVFFKPEVLGKYYSSPSKYSVEDGYLRCGGLWGIQIDNNKSDCVVVFLGDLGRDLPENEQPYWKSFNILPRGGLSRVAFGRSFLGRFVDAERKDLLFKNNFREFQKRWNAKQGWYFFKPLHPEDKHCFDSLHIPLSDEQKEFDEQVLALTKILVDSLNEKELEKGFPKPRKSKETLKGIEKLGKYLISKNASDPSEFIQFLRDLYSLRSSGVGHRKSQNYKMAAARFNIPRIQLKVAFEIILDNAVNLLNYLDRNFLD